MSDQPKITRTTKLELAEKIIAGSIDCAMTDCSEKATHLLVVECWGDNTTFAIHCCEEHFKFLQVELAKRDDHLYTKFTDGKKFFGGDDES